MTQLDPDTVRSILDRVALGTVHWAKVHYPTIVKGDLSLEQEMHVTAGCISYRCMSLIGLKPKERIQY